MSDAARKRPPVIIGADLNTLLVHTGNAPKMRDLHDAITIVANTGLRLRELTQLRWSDVNLEHRWFLIRAMSGERRVPFGAHTLRTLASRRERHRDAEFVFITSHTSLSHQLRRACDQLGINDRGFHAIRNGMVSRLVVTGASIASVCYILGRSDAWSESSHGLLSEEARFRLATCDQARIE